MLQMQQNIRCNADWMSNMQRAINCLSLDCHESDLLLLRSNANAVDATCEDVKCRLMQLTTRLTDTAPEVSCARLSTG